MKIIKRRTPLSSRKYSLLKTSVILFMCLTNPVKVLSQAPFITTWKTDNIGVSNDNQITIPTSGSGYNYNVYWELLSDSNVNGVVANQTGNCTITFPVADTVRIEITGSFPRIYFWGLSSNVDNEKLLTIEQWGDVQWSSFYRAFSYCSNLTYNAVDAPDLNNVTVLEEIFSFCPLFNGNINNWDVSNITTLRESFRGASSFNQPLDNWDVSNVTSLNSTFYGASSFNQDIGSWDVSNVTNMVNTFRNASLFNQDIGVWQVQSPGINNMFRGASSFNQDLNNWDVSNVTFLSGVFYGATAFNGDISDWDVSNVGQLHETFRNATSFNQDISGWDVSNVYGMFEAFRGATSFNQNIGLWNVSGIAGAVSAVENCFRDATSFDQDIGNWDMSGVVNMSGFFQNTGLSFCNYDAILIAWSQQSLNGGVTLNANGINYSSMSISSRQFLTGNLNWTITDAGLLNISASTQDVSCFGGNDGEINLSTNYSENLSYDWTGPDGFADIGLAIGGLVEGTYEVTITDDNGCTFVESYQVLEPNELILSSSDVNDNLCHGDFEGSIDVNAIGGTGSISYDWTGPDGFAGTGSTINGLEVGDYVVTITDDNNCVVVENYQIAEPDQLILSLINIDDNVCYGDFGGSIEVSASGGTGSINYEWTGPDGFAGSGLTVDSLEQGNYDVTVADDNNCIIVETYQVTEPDELVLSLNNLINNDCFGDSNGIIDVSGSGGTGNISFEWTGPDGFSEVGPIVINLPQGVYTVTVTDESNCISAEEYIVDSPLDLEVTGSVEGTEISTTVIGGTPPYSFNWSGPNGFTSSLPNVSVLENGVYQVVVGDSNDCPEVLNEFEVTDVSITDIEKVFLFKIYPNPVNSILSIEYYYPNEGVLSIYASDGRRVGEYTLSISYNKDQSFHVDVSFLNSGVYLYSIRDATDMNVLKTGRLVKQ